MTDAERTEHTALIVAAARRFTEAQLAVDLLEPGEDNAKWVRYTKELHLAGSALMQRVWALNDAEEEARRGEQP